MLEAVRGDRLRVSRKAAEELCKLLEDANLLRGRTEDQILERLIEVVNVLWESKKYKDWTGFGTQGTGHLIDISRGFNDIAVYAVVENRDKEKVVVSVKDEANIIPYESLEGPVTSEDSQKVPIKLRREEERRVEYNAATKQEAPILVRYKNNKMPSEWQIIELKYSEVSAKVQELMAQGIEPDNIEIWTDRKKPRVSVTLV